ncbi:hypothetical protein JTB14_034203 [Gonioctena quinquepunctata]|nr:hypothetical protein JTB14_034203 [Gonioctena quinquepunctata]
MEITTVPGTTACYCSLQNPEIPVIAQERTPLLRSLSRFHNRIDLDKVWVGCLILVLVTGLTIGIYSLCRQGYERVSPITY